ncbi:MAG TPA: sensor domain-containing diguanylate cyclase [Nitriliruptorales bacterium]|nr:sensor domain-containing diguanylate cyclase [Nitriliruptorales bacterium]
MPRTAGGSSGELVPLTHRVRYLQALRAIAGGVVLLFTLLAPEAVGESLRGLVVVTAGYLLITVTAEAFWRLSSQRGLGVFSAMLLVDGLYLQWVAFDSGGVASPFHYLSLLHVGAVSLLASYRTGMKLALWHSLLLIVGFHAQVAGVLHPGVDKQSGWSGSDFKAMIAFVVAFWLTAIATSLFSAVNERELRRRRYDLEALATMARELDLTTRPEDIARVLLDNLLDAFGFARGLVVAAPHGQLRILAVRGWTADDGSPVDVGGTLPEDVGLAHATQLLSGIDPRIVPGLAALLPDARNVVVVPLNAEGRRIGLVIVEHGLRQSSRIERRVVTMTERFTDHAALALQNAWLLERLRAMATTDQLTGLANRRTFEETLAREMSREIRAGEPLSLILLDIDHFKRINDTYGHQAGDEVLRIVARSLADSCRDFDTAARFGGEEFAVVLPGTGPADALAIAERFRTAVEAADTSVPVTISAGAATFLLHGSNADELLKSADEALYASKAAGRNTATLARAREDAPHDPRDRGRQGPPTARGAAGPARIRSEAWAAR